MKLKRNFTLKLHFILDQLVPPIIRDSKFFMYPLLVIMYGKNAKDVFKFKEKVPFMSKDDFTEMYSNFEKYDPDRETDLNAQCIEKIIDNIKGETVLEVGSGKAFLAGKITALGYKITAVDIKIDEKIKLKYQGVIFMNETIENLSFEDKKFDTVICAHTLEHVGDLPQAIKELRRVTKKRLIIVVPKQRPYKYTFDLHIHFFPYVYSFLQVMKPMKDNYYCKVVGGDIYYYEDFSN